jgi:hypothetical protein
MAKDTEYVQVFSGQQEFNISILYLQDIIKAVKDQSVYDGLDLDGEICVINGALISGITVSTKGSRAGSRDQAQMLKDENMPDPTPFDPPADPPSPPDPPPAP